MDVVEVFGNGKKKKMGNSGRPLCEKRYAAHMVWVVGEK